MRKLFNFFAAALVMLAAASCEKNEVLPDNNSEGKVVTLNASINNGGTKTSLGPGVQEGSNPIQYPVYWSENDAIAVIQGSNVYEFTLIDGAGETSATFQSASADGFNPNDDYRAIYPYSCVSKEVSKEGSTIIKYTIPSNQVYVKNSFASGSVPMFALGGDVLEFWGWSGALKLQLTGTKAIKSIEVVSAQNISGLIDSDFAPYIDDYGWETLTFDNNGGKRWVKLDCGEDGVQLKADEPTDFIIAIGRYNGLAMTIIVTDTEGNRRVLRNREKLQISPMNILKMPLVNYDPQDGEYFVVEVVEEKERKTYYGAGIEINGNTWAPVNCGYEPITSESLGYTWGKLYQWNRGTGLGAEDQYAAPDDAKIFQVSNDDPVPGTIDENTWYSNWSKKETGSSWTNNPCPSGWGVPTSSQLQSLANKLSSSRYDSGYGQYGRNGGDSYSVVELFLPYSGNINYNGRFYGRNESGYYWSSNKKYLAIGSGVLGIYDGANAASYGYTIRCIKK